jgi:hypothetical protein
MRCTAKFVSKGFFYALCAIAVTISLFFLSIIGMLAYEDYNGTLADHMTKDQSCMVPGTPPKGCPGNRSEKSN